MTKRATIASIGGAVVVAVLAVTLALALWAKPASTRLGYSSYTGAQPQGCQAVAPGSWTAICQTGTVSHPSGGNGHLVCRPVAPGAFTEICTRR